METLGYPFPSQKDEKVITDLCNMFERLYVTEDIEKQTILIRKSQKIKLPDAIIAATAIKYGLTLVTHNIIDFNKIVGLKTLSPTIR